MTSVALKTFFAVKEGMTRIFGEGPREIPVTVVRLVDNVITQVKTLSKDGHEAYQVGYLTKRGSLIKKPIKGHVAKAGPLGEGMCRFREVRQEGVSQEALGQKVSLEHFRPGAFVDVQATGRGKGFQGVVKKFGFRGGPASHGSKFHRAGGSIGNRATPREVWKNKKMPGRMGGKRVTIQNLEIVQVNEQGGYLLLKGAVPGPPKGVVRISLAKKKA